jgi:hypothetical protein
MLNPPLSKLSVRDELAQNSVDAGLPAGAAAAQALNGPGIKQRGFVVNF